MSWQNTFDSLVGGSWPNVSDTIKAAIHSRLAKLIAGDNAEFREALSNALADSAIDSTETKALLGHLLDDKAPSGLFNSSLLKELAEKLKDGDLTPDEITDACVEWVAKRFDKGSPAQELLKAARDGHLSKADVEQALYDWLKRTGNTDLADKLKQAFASGHPLTLRSTITLLCCYLLQKKGIKLEGTSHEAFVGSLTDALNALSIDPKIVSLLRALIARDFPKAAHTALDILGITLDEKWIQAAVKGAFGPVLKDELITLLRKWVPNLTESDARSLAETLIDLFKGTKKLIAEVDEQTALGFNDDDWKKVQRLRRVVYAALLAFNGGPVVPTAAMAQPHVFAAAQITVETPLKSLVSLPRLSTFRTFIVVFTRTEFSDPGFDVNTATFQAGATLLTLFDSL